MGDGAGQVFVSNLRFEQYILGTGLNKFALQIFVGAGAGEDNYGSVVIGVFGEKLQHFHTVDIGQAIVKQDSVKIFAIKLREALARGAGLSNGDIPLGFFKRSNDRQAIQFVVIDQ